VRFKQNKLYNKRRSSDELWVAVIFTGRMLVLSVCLSACLS